MITALRRPSGRGLHLEFAVGRRVTVSVLLGVRGCQPALAGAWLSACSCRRVSPIVLLRVPGCQRDLAGA